MAIKVDEKVKAEETSDEEEDERVALLLGKRAAAATIMIIERMRATARTKKMKSNFTVLVPVLISANSVQHVQRR